jgi:ATP-dependent Lon protease
MLPERNRRDLEEIPADARDQLQLVWIENADQALATALSSIPLAAAA